MKDGDERPALRALAIGEIFDRAVTMYVRNFPVFTLIVLTLLVPASVLEYMYTAHLGGSFTQLLRQIQHPGAATSPFDGSQIAALCAFAVFFILVAPFANNAVAVGVAAIYAGRKPNYRDDYARVFGRWGQLLGTSVLSLLVLLGMYVGLVIVLTIAVITAVALARGSVVVSVVLVIVGIVAFIAAIVFLIMVVMACAFALYATTIEERRPADAIGDAFARIFNRREFRKALLIALAYLALELGTTLLSSVIAVVMLELTHSDVLQVAVSTIISAVTTSLFVVILAVYYYDVRTRMEGLDLEVALERLTA